MGMGMNDVFTDDDLAQAARMETLGPAYFAARRMAEALMVGVEVKPLHEVAKKVSDEITQVVYEYVEGHFRSDLEANLQGHIRDMVERTVRALLTGEEWAMKQYPLSQYHDGETIRAAVAKHGGDGLLMRRIAELEKENTRLVGDLKWYRER